VSRASQVKAVLRFCRSLARHRVFWWILVPLFVAGLFLTWVYVGFTIEAPNPVKLTFVGAKIGIWTPKRSIVFDVTNTSGRLVRLLRDTWNEGGRMAFLEFTIDAGQTIQIEACEPDPWGSRRRLTIWWHFEPYGWETFLAKTPLNRIVRGGVRKHSESDFELEPPETKQATQNNRQ